MSTALLVEDDQTQIEYFSNLLERLGYVVSIAADGMEALALCQASAFDLIVTDVRMPRLNGISFIRNALKFSSHLPPRIVVITAMDDRVIRRDALEAGAAACLVKPISAADFALRDIATSNGTQGRLTAAR